MPPGRGADRIGVSLGSHRPTVILKLPCLVEKKRTKVRSLSPLPRTGIARQLGQIGATLYGNILPILFPIGDKGRNDLSIYCSPGRRLACLVAFTHPQDVVWASQEP